MHYNSQWSKPGDDKQLLSHSQMMLCNVQGKSRGDWGPDSQVVQWNLSVMDTIRTPEIVLYVEVSLIMKLNNTVTYYYWTRATVLKRRGGV